MKVQLLSLDAGTLGGKINLMRPLPRETSEGDTLYIDAWGDFRPLKDFAPEFASLLPVVTGEAFSHALHGYMRPLAEQLGLEPRYQLIKVPDPHRQCSRRAKCPMFDERRCHIRSSKLPECWLPEGAEEAQRILSMVTLAWAEGRYVIITEGDEFVL